MTLGAECPRCASPVSDEDGTWRCLDHGVITPLWRPATADYGTFAEHLTRAGGMPTFLPWPLTPGWTVTDFGTVAVPDGDGKASFITVTGAMPFKRKRSRRTAPESVSRRPAAALML